MRIAFQRQRRRSARGPQAFTLMELLVVIAIIALLAGLLLPLLARARDKGKTAKCQSNLRQLAMAAMMYDDDHQVYPIGWPPADGFTGPLFPIWYRQLQPYLGRKTNESGRGVFICPSSLQKALLEQGTGPLREGGFWGFLAYGQNAYINNGRRDLGSRHVKDLSGTVLYADTDGWDACLYPDGDSTANVCFRHSGGNEKSSDTDRGSKGRKARNAALTRFLSIPTSNSAATRRSASSRSNKTEADGVADVAKQPLNARSGINEDY